MNSHYEEIAAGVYCLAMGKGIRGVNVYLVHPSDVPGLPDGECVPTPGHTPGHVAFFRRRDGVLISGDALLTVNANSLWDLVRNNQTVSGPPRIATWSWPKAMVSAAVLAELEPRVLAGGHGTPLTGAGTARAVRAFSDRGPTPCFRHCGDAATERSLVEPRA
jgi:glyoxylase-like metal-dependent hydrolase (beta-lactamase superfamily II)